jgi:hypothetical protein
MFCGIDWICGGAEELQRPHGGGGTHGGAEQAQPMGEMVPNARNP